MAQQHNLDNWRQYVDLVRLTDSDKARLDSGEMLEVEVIRMEMDGMPVLSIKTATKIDRAHIQDVNQNHLHHA